MQYSKISSFLIILNIFMFTQFTFPVVIGSTTEVSSITSPAFFPALDSDNTMLGFTQFQGGFTLEDATTSCTFNATFPVSGTINMNGGTLYLMQDMVITNTAQLEGLGKIIGNNHTLELCQTITYLPANLTLIKDLIIDFHHNIDLSSNVTAQGNCSINGHDNIVMLTPSSGFIVDTDSSLELHNLKLNNVQNNITCVDNTAHIILKNANLNLTQDWIFNYGDILIQNNVSLRGSSVFDYQSSMPLSIASQATCLLDGGITYKFGKKTTEDANPLFFYDSDSILVCNECTLMITATGATCAKGTIVFNGNVIIETESTDTTYGLILGDNDSFENDVYIYFNPCSSVELTSGTLIYNNVLSNRLNAANPGSMLTLDEGTVFYFASTCTLPQYTLQLKHNDASSSILALAPNTCLYFDNTNIKIPTINDATYVARSNNGNSYILDTNNSLYLSSGQLQSDIVVINQGTKISGNGSIANSITLYNSNASLQLNMQGTVAAPINLNGGKLTIDHDLILTSTHIFISSGTVDLQSHAITFNPPDTQEFDVDITFSGNKGTLNLSDDLVISGTQTIIGNVIIDGNDNTITFTGSGAFVVAPSSQLTLKNVNLNNIRENTIYCSDNSGTIIIDNAIWTQSDDTTFEYGTLNFRGNVLMGGQNCVFNYNSTCTSTILSHSTLTLDSLFTFSYNPSNASTSALAFYDSTSQLSLKHTNLYIVPGLQLIKGQLLISQAPSIYALGSGLTCGDATTSDNDLHLIFNDSSTLTLAEGLLNYMNLSTNAIQSWNRNTIAIKPNTTLILYEDMYLGTGEVFLGSNDYSATYIHKQSACPTTSDIIGDWGGNWIEEDLCSL